MSKFLTRPIYYTIKSIPSNNGFAEINPKRLILQKCKCAGKFKPTKVFQWRMRKLRSPSACFRSAVVHRAYAFVHSLPEKRHRMQPRFQNTPRIRDSAMVYGVMFGVTRLPRVSTVERCTCSNGIANTTFHVRCHGHRNAELLRLFMKCGNHL